jgi:hypothetical protein
MLSVYDALWANQDVFASFADVGEIVILVFDTVSVYL